MMLHSWRRLGASGTSIVVARCLRDRTDWEGAAPLACAIMIMIVTMLSRIDSGVRYVMLGYVFMSMLAALAVVTLWQRREHSSRRTRCCYRSAALDGGFICDVAS